MYKISIQTRSKFDLFLELPKRQLLVKIAEINSNNNENKKNAFLLNTTEVVASKRHLLVRDVSCHTIFASHYICSMTHLLDFLILLSVFCHQPLSNLHI